MILYLLGMEMFLQIKKVNQQKCLIHISIVEKTSGVPPENYLFDTNNAQKIIEGIIRKYERHPSVLKIKNNFVSSITFNFLKAEVAGIDPFLKQTDTKKATGPDTIPLKLVKMSANVIDKHLCNIMNMDFENYNVPDNTKQLLDLYIRKNTEMNQKTIDLLFHY